MVTRAVGKGSIGLLGTLPDEGLMKEVIAGEVKASGATSTSLSLPVGVELCTRSDATHSVLIVINHNTTPQDVTLNGRYKSLLAGTFLRVAGVDGQRSTVFALPGQGVAVLTLERVP
jgi:beta-galactosidase GanA